MGNLIKHLRLAMFALVVTGLTPAAFGQNGHYITLNASIDQNTGCYEVNLKEAGLGNSGFTSVTYALTADAAFTAACYTKSTNQIQGQPKSGSGTATSFTTLTIRNGSTSGTVSLCPASFSLPDPGCTGNQKLVILSASYSNVKLDDQLPPDVTAGVVSLPSLTANDLFVVVK